MPHNDTKASPTRTMVPLKAVKFALEELEPDGNPDDFADLIEAAIRLETPMMTPGRVIAQHFGVEDKVVKDWAIGAVMPTPRVRRAAVAMIREHLKTCRMG